MNSDAVARRSEVELDFVDTSLLVVRRATGWYCALRPRTDRMVVESSYSSSASLEWTLPNTYVSTYKDGENMIKPNVPETSKTLGISTLAESDLAESLTICDALTVEPLVARDTVCEDESGRSFRSSGGLVAPSAVSCKYEVSKSTFSTRVVRCVLAVASVATLTGMLRSRLLRLDRIGVDPVLSTVRT